MLPLSALYFPGTRPDQHLIRKLLFLFDSVCCYQPTGPESTSGEASLCNGYTPVPLGENLTRIQHLLQDMQGNAGEYYRGHLATLSQSVSSDRDEASVWALVANINRQPYEKITPEDELVWRAVLHLKLTEQVVQEEEKINSALAAIAEKQADLLSSLRGNDDEERQLLSSQLHIQVPARPTINMEQLTMAWGQLFLRDRTAQQPSMLVTDQQEAADMLISAYEKIFQNKQKILQNNLPIPIGTIPLPSLTADRDTDAYSKARNSLRENTENSLRVFAKLLTAASEAGAKNESFSEIRKAFNEEIPLWTEAIKGNGATTVDTVLEFFCFPGCSLQQLFSVVCGSGKTGAPPEPARTGIFAVARGTQR